MTGPLVVIIPHHLGKAEASRRLRSGRASVRTAFAGKLSVFEEAWSEDHLDFRVGLVGQMATGTIDVADEHVRLAVELPRILALLAGKAKALIQKHGQLMLEGK
jgi:hypothetical protein